MQLKFKKPTTNIVDLIRQAGYSYRGASAGEMNFIKRVGIEEYPHFHIYAREEGGDDVIINLHLDQKKSSHSGNRAHSAEHEGVLIEQEAERVKQAIASNQ